MSSKLTFIQLKYQRLRGKQLVTISVHQSAYRTQHLDLRVAAVKPTNST